MPGERIERHAAHDLDDARRGIDAALGIAPSFTGLVLHGRGQPERDQIGERSGLPHRRASRLAEAGRVRQDLGNGEVSGPARRSSQARELGKILRHRIGDSELALVLQHQHGRGGDRLGHRGDPEQRVQSHGTFCLEIGEPRGVEVQHRIPGHHGGDRTRDLVFRDHFLHRRIDAGKLRGLADGEERGGERQEHGEAVKTHGGKMYRVGRRPSRSRLS